MVCGTSRNAFGLLVSLLAVCVTSSRCSTSTPPSAGFWYEDGAFALPDEITARLGGPLQSDEVRAIKSVSTAELERAFSGLRITVSDRRDAYWRVGVVAILPNPGTLPTAGQSLSLGVLGGSGWLGFRTLALIAIDRAPPGTSRQGVIEGIGRGIGRAAAHEIAHQILGRGLPEDRTDPNSYEYFTSDRQAQFYGELRWNSAWPLLQKRLGR
jgi:hypothetical protein